MIANKLVKMANQIAANFQYGADQDKAVDAIVDHMTRFWTPLMLGELIEQTDKGDAGLTGNAAKAVAIIAERRRNAA